MPEKPTNGSSVIAPEGAGGSGPNEDRSQTPAQRRNRSGLAMIAQNYAAVGLLIAFIIFFSIAKPHTFPTVGNFKTIVFTEGVLALLSLGVVAPLVAGEYDLSIGSSFGLGAVLSAKLVSTGTSVPLMILVVLAAGVVIGLFNSTLIVRFSVSSFIATLGTGIVLDGVALWASGGQTIYQNIGPNFTALGTNELWFIPLPGVYVIVLTAVLWYLLEATPFGREMYVTGYGRDAGRLAGIRVERRIVAAFVISGVVGSLSGIVSAANLGSASPGLGDSFLLPAFAAAFLGATTIRSGRFNILGTLVAAALLAVGITGLELMGAHPYVQNYFYGGSLIISVAFAQAGVKRLKAQKAA